MWKTFVPLAGGLREGGMEKVPVEYHLKIHIEFSILLTIFNPISVAVFKTVKNPVPVLSETRVLPADNWSKIRMLRIRQKFRLPQSF